MERHRGCVVLKSNANTVRRHHRNQKKIVLGVKPSLVLRISQMIVHFSGQHQIWYTSSIERILSWTMFISLFISLFCILLFIFMFSASILVNKVV